MKADPKVDAWNISADEFPHFGTSEEKLQFLIGYAVLAPSTHNSQPWQFRVRGDEVELRADRTRACRVADPEDRELIISCGAALSHLRIALRHFGYLGRVDLFPDDGDVDLLARVRLGLQPETCVEDTLLFHAIVKRRTNRQTFSSQPVPEPLLSALEMAADREQAWLHVVRAEDDRYALADLIAEADRVQWSNRSFRIELAAWAHPNRSASRDGIPGYAQGIDDLMSYAGPLVMRTFDLGEGQAAKDRDLATGSPVLAVLGTSGDSPAEWLATGQALARVLLRARIEDVWASFLNQPIEVPSIRHRLPHLLGRPGSPQLVLRLGFGPDVRPTPRRFVDEVLI